MTSTSRLTRALRLPRAERRLVVEAMAELARASVLLRVLGWARVGPPLVHVVGDRHDAELARAIVIAVDRAARTAPWRPTCLRQSLATQQMLRRRGLSGSITFDMPQGYAGETGHAWVDITSNDPPSA